MFSKFWIYVIAGALFSSCVSFTAAAPNSSSLLPLTQYVNPFAGTAPGSDKFGFGGNSGDVFPGALWPRGMVQYSPDTPTNLPGGYNYPDTSIKGFSLTHFSGRGCTAYQDLPFMPIVGNIGVSPIAVAKPFPYNALFSHANEVARPGYYKVHLDTGVDVELTATIHTGLARFTFPNGPAGTILINATGSVNGNGDPTAFTISGSNEVSGNVTSHVGCGNEKYTLYFVTQFDQPFQAHGVWNAAIVTASADTISGGQTGAYVSFDTTKKTIIQAKTGISYVSLANARANLTAETPAWDFQHAEDACTAAWNRVLNRIQVRGAATGDARTFYTALYHSFIHPNVFNDVNGQYFGFDGDVHTISAGHNHYENIPGWDEYRSLIPLQSLLVPQETSDVAQSLVDDAKQGGGGLPRWQQTSRNSNGMVGDSPLIILATAYAYGARDFDTTSALKAMIADASDPNTKSDGHHVRSGLSHYLAEGYIPGTGYETASSTLEYSSDDFALSQFAKSVGDTQDSEIFLKQAQNWKNLFNAANGYINPRNTDGTWLANYNPASDIGFVEGSGTQYTWMVPFNLSSLFKDMGGNGAAIARLDTFFTRLNDGTDQYCFIGNEPCFEVPWEYDWTGKPSGTQAVIHRIQNEVFSAEPNGLPGNDDGGATSSWYVWSALGLYPEIPGVAGYAVSSPRLPDITIIPDGRASIRVTAPGASSTNAFVTSLNIDGKIHNSPWIPFDLISKGAIITFGLGLSATDWGSDPSAAPPSFDAAPNVVAPNG